MENVYEERKGGRGVARRREEGREGEGGGEKGMGVGIQVFKVFILRELFISYAIGHVIGHAIGDVIGRFFFLGQVGG